MNCREAIDFLADYVDGALPWRQRAIFKLHLALCRHCRRYVASYARTIHLARDAGRDLSPADCREMPEALVQAMGGGTPWRKSWE